jgi:hypothetical protein
MNSSGSEMHLRKVPVSLQHGRPVTPVFNMGHAKTSHRVCKTEKIKILYGMSARLGLPNGNRT